MKSLKNILAGILVGASALTTSADMIKPYVQTTLASDYVAPSGAAVEERCRQDWASISAHGFTLGIFQNQFRGERGISERDYCVSYSKPLTKTLTGTVGFQVWDYPNGRFGDFDSIESASLKYSGKINANVAYTHINQHDSTEDGDNICVKISKPISLVDGKVKVSLSPSVSAAWLNNFYSNSGLSQVSGGLSLDVSYKNWCLNLSGTKQKALVSDVKDLNWGTASIGYQF